MEQRQEDYEVTAGDGSTTGKEEIDIGEANNEQVAQAAIIPEDEPDRNKEENVGSDPEVSEASGAETEEGRSDSKKDNLRQRISKKFGLSAVGCILKTNRSGIIGIVVALCLVSSSLIMKWYDAATEGKSTRIPVQMYVTSVSRELTDIFNFKRFLIFSPNIENAYLSLSVAVKTSNDRVYHEIKGNKASCRSIIYSILSRSVDENGIGSQNTDILKKKIIDALNSRLREGKIDQVVVGDLIYV